jgi:hypothetical protein
MEKLAGVISNCEKNPRSASHEWQDSAVTQWIRQPTRWRTSCALAVLKSAGDCVKLAVTNRQESLNESEVARLLAQAQKPGEQALRLHPSTVVSLEVTPKCSIRSCIGLHKQLTSRSPMPMPMSPRLPAREIFP